MFAETRNLTPTLQSDLKRKFVFLSGPRQVGKTTLSKNIIKENKGVYLVYDDDSDRKKILNKEYLTSAWVCLDEFHKFPRWKNHIKGVYDAHHEHLHLLLTGSARLDVFQRSGDSLFGRYFLHHLHPFTLGEMNSHALAPLLENPLQSHKPLKHLEELWTFGGFPEPLFSQSKQEHLRWSNARRQLLVREDLRELTHIELLALVEQLMWLLPERVGSTLSYNSLAEDIRVSPLTIKNWLDAFARLFIVFPISPYSERIHRSIQKQPKYFLYDFSQISAEGPRFENLVASHLWKAAQVWTDVGYANVGLHFIRDRDQREVDFLLTRNRKPWFLVETKLSDVDISPSLQYYSKRLNVPGIQLIKRPGVEKHSGNVRVISADRWLGFLP